MRFLVLFHFADKCEFEIKIKRPSSFLLSLYPSKFAYSFNECFTAVCLPYRNVELISKRESSLLFVLFVNVSNRYSSPTMAGEGRTQLVCLNEISQCGIYRWWSPVLGINLAAMQQEYTEMIETASRNSSLSHAGYYLQNNIIIFDRMQQSFARLLSRNAIIKEGKTRNHSDWSTRVSWTSRDVATLPCAGTDNNKYE